MDDNLEEQEELAQEGQLSIDVYYKDDELVIISPIAGASMENIEVILKGDILIIRGERVLPEKVEEKDYKYKECFWGPFSRTIALPKNLDTAQIKAFYNNGILMIKIPKKESESTRRIEIMGEF